MAVANDKVYDVVIIGAGVGGICQIKHLVDHDFDAIVLEANDDLGGTWYSNRYPGCRFDSESYTYGYAFSQELLDEWHWKERFSPQPENLRYLNYVADKFNLRQYMRFGVRTKNLTWDEQDRTWTVELEDGEQFVTRFVITSVGVLSVPNLPNVEGIDTFKGESFHTFDWPHEPVSLEGRKVGIIGTGATGIQIIPEIADKVAELHVFQRNPNWSVPLNNGPISEAEMADIRARYDEIFATCNKSAGAFDHLPDRRGYHNLTPEERRATWDELYDRPGFALLIANFPETNMEEEPNRELSEYVAERIRQRIDDPAVAEKLIPKDHAFGMKRLPLETNYFEAYNRDNVHLVDISETPIERITERGIKTTDKEYDLDLIIYATGFDAVIGALKQLDIKGEGGLSLRDKWQEETTTYLGLLNHGFPNLLMVAGPQSVSGSTNYPRAIEDGVNWITRLLLHARKEGVTRIEARQEAEQNWVAEVKKMQDRMMFSHVQSWFTGYAPNAEGNSHYKVRYNAYWGGAPRYRQFLQAAADEGYGEIELE